MNYAQNYNVSDALKRKLSQVDSTLRILQRTVSSNDYSVYQNEMSSVLDAAIEQMEECERLRAQWNEDKHRVE